MSIQMDKNKVYNNNMQDKENQKEMKLFQEMSKNGKIMKIYNLITNPKI